MVEKEINKPGISIELIKSVFGEIFKDNPEKLPKEIYNPGELEKRILSGYWYRLGNSNIETKGRRRVLANTGKGGVLLYIKTCREDGLNDDNIIAASIEVYVDGEWVSINDPRLRCIKRGKPSPNFND